VGAEVTLSDRLFQIDGPATGKARPPTVDSLKDGTSRQLECVERMARRPGSAVAKQPCAAPILTTFDVVSSYLRGEFIPAPVYFGSGL